MNSDDRDWLEPEKDNVVQLKPLAKAPFRGVFVDDGTFEAPLPIGSLMRALSRVPSTPESTIFIGDMVYARCSQESATWELTDGGRIRLMIERRVVTELLNISPKEAC